MTAAAAVARSLGIGGIATEGAAGAVRCSPLVSGRQTLEDSFFTIFVSIPLASHLVMEAVQCQDVVVSAAAWRLHRVSPS